MYDSSACKDFRVKSLHICAQPSGVILKEEEEEVVEKSEKRLSEEGRSFAEGCESAKSLPSI